MKRLVNFAVSLWKIHVEIYNLMYAKDTWVKSLSVLDGSSMSYPKINQKNKANNSADSPNGLEKAFLKMPWL